MFCLRITHMYWVSQEQKCDCLRMDSVLPRSYLASCLTSIWPQNKWGLNIWRKLKWLNDRVLHKHKRKLTRNLPNSPRPLLSFSMTLEIRSELQTDTLGTVFAVGSSTSNESRYSNCMRQNKKTKENESDKQREHVDEKLWKRDKEQVRLTTKCITQQQTAFLSPAPTNVNFNWSTTN